MAICSVSSERALSFRGLFFYSWPLCHVSHMQVLYNVIFVHWLAVRELELFICPVFFFLPSPLMYTWPFCLYSIPISGPLSSTPATRDIKHYISLCARVCVCVWMVYVHACAPRPFVVCAAAYSKAHVYSLHSSPPSTSSLFTETNVVLILIFV